MMIMIVAKKTTSPTKTNDDGDSDDAGDDFDEPDESAAFSPAGNGSGLSQSGAISFSRRRERERVLCDSAKSGRNLLPFENTKLMVVFQRIRLFTHETWTYTHFHELHARAQLQTHAYINVHQQPHPYSHTQAHPHAHPLEPYVTTMPPTPHPQRHPLLRPK